MRFEGLLGGPALARLFRSARAVVVPSLFPETFGYVVLEAFAVGTPVVVHEGGGALYETGFLSGGGLAYRTDTELLTAMRRMVHDHRLHDDLAERGYAVRMGEWSESEHLERYFDLIGTARAGARTLALAAAARARAVACRARLRSKTSTVILRRATQDADRPVEQPASWATLADS